MKDLLLVLVIAVFSHFTKCQSIGTFWEISDDSHLAIHGTSNINSFTCSYTIPFSKTSILILADTNGFILEKGSLRFYVMDFDCNNNRMNTDFRKTMKAKEHPALGLQIKNVAR